MKKFIFGLTALVTIGFSGNAQQNNQNEFDYVGKIHNEIVNQFLVNYDSSLSIQQICAKVQSIANENQSYLALKESTINYHLIENSKDDFTNNFRNVINSTNASTHAKQEMQVLIDYMFELGFATQKPTFDNFYSYVVAFESKIKKDTKLNNADKKLILSSTSTARYSGYLWYNKIQQTEISSKRAWWNWVVVGVADVAGTFIGGGVNVGTGAGASSAAFTLTDPGKK